MKLLGRDLSARQVVEELESRLRARGLLPQPIQEDEREDGIEPRVDPLAFNLAALEQHADPTQPLPLHTHRGGAGQLVVAAKWAFRKTCQVFINETLSRQRVFNGHVRDSYAQLSAEVVRLRAEVDQLRKHAAPAPAAKSPRPRAAQPPEPTVAKKPRAAPARRRK